jgi:hypothetical protein
MMSDFQRVDAKATEESAIGPQSGAVALIRLHHAVVVNNTRFALRRSRCEDHVNQLT